MTIATLAAREISHSFGAKVILDKVTFTLAPGQRVGIVGPNGVGKSTLLRIVAGLQEPESGTVLLTPGSARVGYLPQEAVRSDETLQAYLARRTGVADAISGLDAASDALAAGTPGADDIYADALDAYMALGASDFDARVGEVLAEVGLDARVTELPMNVLSGGQAARAGLGALLLSRFDIYLLDEPTNNLDFAGLEQLESFVQRNEAGMLIVSHDRSFLDKVITSVLEIDVASHQASEYRGSWAEYLEGKALARRHAEQAYAENQTQRSALTTRMHRQKQWTEGGVRKEKKSPIDNDKFVKNFRIEGSENQASKIAASERALSRLEKVEKPWEGWELHMEFLAGPRSGDIVARLDNAVIERGDFSIGPVDLEVNWADRLAITGPNGSGKTTLLNALLGRLPLQSGQQHLGPGVILGEIDQTREVLDSSSSLVEVFAEHTGVLVQEARSLLAKFDLSASHVERAAQSLSPGERTRATLAILMAKGTNCLILDEPTNHLDLDAIEQLETALDRFDGTVILITHDRAFLEKARITRTISPNPR